MLSPCYVPAWASQTSWWTKPPPSYGVGLPALLPHPLGRPAGPHPSGQVPCHPLQRPRAGAAVLERAQPVAVPLPATHQRRRLLRGAHLPGHAQSVPRRRHAGAHQGPGRRRRHGADRPQRLHAHQPSALRRLPRPQPRGQLLRRLLAPPVHARRHHLPAPRPTAQRPFGDGHALQPEHAAAPLPHQALLPHRVRLQHAPVDGVRLLHGERRQAGGVPAAGVRAGAQVPAGQGAVLVPALRFAPDVRAGRAGASTRAYERATGRASRPGTRSATCPGNERAPRGADSASARGAPIQNRATS